jgi:cytochrome c-type biogenesis protein CcmH/NrfG
MRIPRQLLYSALTSSLAIASVVLPARAQTQTPKTAGEPSQGQPSIPPPRLPVPMTTTGDPSIRIKKPNAPSPQQPGAVGNCEEQAKNLLADAPNSSRANYDLGMCYLSSKKFDDAAAAFQKAFQLIPEWIKKLEERVMSNRPKLNKKQEEELVRNAIPSLTLFSLGWACHQARRYDEAVAAYRQVPPLYPAGEEARYQMAMVHLLQGNREAALEQVAKMEKSFEQRLDVESKLLVPDLIPSDESISNGAPIIPTTTSIRPTMLYREKARYTEEARQVKLSGTVVLQVIFRSDGAPVIQRVIEYLPYGLTLTAAQAASRIRFNPAIKDGAPVSTRGPSRI